VRPKDCRPNGSDAHPTVRLHMRTAEWRDGCRDKSIRCWERDAAGVTPCGFDCTRRLGRRASVRRAVGCSDELGGRLCFSLPPKKANRYTEHQDEI
jgi:hypothetical protein